MNKKILIVSHERAGTHFLIDAIAENYKHFNDEQVDLYAEHYLPPSSSQLITYKNNLQKSIRNYFGNSNNRLFKSHHDVKFFDGILSEIKKEFNILYMKRSVLDTLTSCYHYYSYNPHVDFPFSKDIDKFLFDTKPYDHLTDSAYSFKRSENNVLRWFNHTSGWEKAGVHVVNYESLNSNFQNEMTSISTALKIEGRLYYKRPALGGVYPRKGIVGDHKNLFSVEQIQKVNDILKKQTN